MHGPSETHTSSIASCRRAAVTKDLRPSFMAMISNLGSVMAQRDPYGLHFVLA
jgi:hypothetical protein